jgi:hypothetical protein
VLGHALDENTRRRNRLAPAQQSTGGGKQWAQWALEVAGWQQSHSQRPRCARRPRSSDHRRGCFQDRDNSLGRIEGDLKVGVLRFDLAKGVWYDGVILIYTRWSKD